MNTIKLSDKKTTKIIAHRGGNLEIENTNAAFVSAANRSYYGIETDVHKTTDGKFVIYHDDNTARLTQENLNVEASDFETLRNAVFKSYRGRIARKDTVMPSLEEYVDICHYYGKVSVLELKNPMSKETVLQIYNAVREGGQLQDTVFISFSFRNLAYLKEIDPTVSAQFLIDANEDGLKDRLNHQLFDMERLHKHFTGRYVTAMLDVLREYRMDIDAYHGTFADEYVAECHKRDIAVNVWTVNDEQIAQKFINLGVDYITSDCLE